MNRWQLMEILKGNKKATTKDMHEIEKMDNTELKEAVIEIVLAVNRQEFNYSDLAI